jgi:uncharacterized Fe-S center protein
MGEEDRLKKVIFIKDLDRLDEALQEFDLNVYSNKKSLIKIHMGEPNNKYFSPPDFVKLIVKSFNEICAYPFLYDTTVLYNSRRKYVDGYMKVAKMHGFTFDNVGCDVLIDEEGIPVNIDNNTYFVGKELFNTDCIIGVSHFKGHIATGMGGTIKNFGMGGVTKDTKEFMHHGCRPRFNHGNCKFCGVCSEVCPFEAINITDDNWKINRNSCFGCGVCIENCEYDAINYEINDLSYFLACSTKACVENKHAIYINDVNRIARSCDCDPDAGPIICPDIGYFISNDPVAVDAASLDFVNKVKPNVFVKENKVDPYKQIKYGEKIGLGSSSYELVNLS